ncbi:hypothetical protein MXB_1479 [Myxobolus squamalis]|nr:hypothetical protein MXB_1479 [Myxobolus squamalis]
MIGYLKIQITKIYQEMNKILNLIAKIVILEYLPNLAMDFI